MNESILERFKKQVEEDRLNENNELPKDTSLSNPMDKKEYEKQLEALRNSEIDIENKYKQAMNRLVHLKENELSEDGNIKEVEITKNIACELLVKINNLITLEEYQWIHIVSNGVKFPIDKTVEICEKYDLPHVPIVDDNYILPDTLDELQAYVEGQKSLIDNLPREGIVFYDKETGQQYFKFVSPEFLMKYHN